MDPRELRQTFVLANAFKEGDLPVGGTRDDRVRADARRALLATTLRQIRTTPLVGDRITTVLGEALGTEKAREIDALTVGDVRRILAGPEAAAWTSRYRGALTSEAIAAVVKVMSEDELSHAARAVFNPLPGDGVAIGSPGHFGSRIQPNSPGDDEQEILLSVLEGLSFGCGDVIIGLNPASDDLDTIVRLERLLADIVGRLKLPTRFCVLSDIVKQHRARERTHVDVGFQSLAGTSKALGGMVGLDVDGVLDLASAFDGLYFETGQGSAVTNGAAEGVDMVTLESRAHGLARLLQRTTGKWTIVNDVAGFIGPEVFRTVEQLERACLEDIVMAKLHGLTMGLDICATFHMGIPPAALRAATERLATRAAPAYLMAVAGNADPMLGYLTTSFREHPRLRRRCGRQPASAMQRRLDALGLAGTRPGDAESIAGLFAAYTKEGGDRRSQDVLREEGLRVLHELRQRGFDLGQGSEPDGTLPAAAEARIASIYEHARRALYAAVDDSVIRDVAPRHHRARTRAASRDEYLAHRSAGEALRPADADDVARSRRARAQVQIVISDGLNANAVNEQARALIPALRRRLSEAGQHVAETDVVLENGRVRAGYHVGQLVDPLVLVHFIGERPGTGLNTLSAYLTYGRDRAGAPRWAIDLDHAATTAICGIHPRGLPPAQAVDAIARTVVRMLAERRSGVALHASDN